MKKLVTIKNRLNGKLFGQPFIDDDEKMNAWIAKNLAEENNAWGKDPLFWNGSEWVDTFAYEDKTAEHDAELAAKAARKVEISELKAAAAIIDGWNSMSDISLPFLKKFFKRILKEMAD